MLTIYMRRQETSGEGGKVERSGVSDRLVVVLSLELWVIMGMCASCNWC